MRPRLRDLLRCCLLPGGAWLLAATAGLATAQPVPAPAAHTPTGWTARLAPELAALDRRHRLALGVYVQDLDTGATAAHRAEESWYLASMVKLPVAIAVLRGVEAGQFTLDTPLRLRAGDYVDGAGPTNALPVATPLAVRWLVEQMMVHSDNTATDMLVGLVGLPAVNDTVRSMVPAGIGRITPLAEVRRQVYGQLTPEATHLAGADLLRLHRQPGDTQRLALLAQLTGVPEREFRRLSLEQAWEAYYATGLNSGRLDAYGQLLARLAEGSALNSEHTRWLLDVMARAQTGRARIVAGLPAASRFAHKTGTQRRRVCDAGLLYAQAQDDRPRAVVVACTRGEPSLARAEAALRDVGQAICRAGAFHQGSQHAPACPAPPPALDRLVPVPGDAAADGADGAARGGLAR